MDCFIFLHIELSHNRKWSVWNLCGIISNQKVKDNIADFSANDYIHSPKILFLPKQNVILQPP